MYIANTENKWNVVILLVILKLYVMYFNIDEKC